MQEKSRKGLLEILKSHRDLQRPALKAGRDNLKDFRSNSEPFRNLSESFEDASEREVKPRALNKNVNGNQLETEWVQLRPEKAQQKLFQYIIHNYAQEENLYFKLSLFFKFIIHSLQNFNL